ncbi:DUF1987 domain-containing protein [Methanospirillum hungatei]|uniref:DUF1987 domain-containing protein n=1 Tax=Methanospirillum hungatei TaxID=2203 RepID=UPI0026F159F6|nr:DUF1987 domain-containing protein [Methanospirillum hungatei]MCA1917182.1 DUF1987 domain-containing protein [Methanospirillum hungatei]
MLHIPATKSTPEIFYSEESDMLSIIGESYPENTFAFFEPVFEWLNKNLPHMKKLHLHVNISYMNSSSTKCMLDILDLLAKSYQAGSDISVSWYYDRENDRALDIAEEFEEDAEVPFQIIASELAS